MGGRGGYSSGSSTSRKASFSPEGIVGRKTTVEFGSRNITASVKSLTPWSKNGYSRVYFKLESSQSPYGFPTEGYIDTSKNGGRRPLDFTVDVGGGRRVVFPGGYGGTSGSKRSAISDMAKDLFGKRQK